MAYNPELGRDRGAEPARVHVQSSDGLVADVLRAALVGQTQLTLVDQPELADVVLADLGPQPDVSFEPFEALLAEVAHRGQRLVALVPDECAATKALQAGAHGAVQRRADANTLRTAVIAVRAGLCVIDGTMAQSVFAELPARDRAVNPDRRDAPAVPRTRNNPDAPLLPENVHALTAREHEVLQLLALGLSNKHIAKRLSVSLHTVKFHVNAILGKLDVDSRTAAVSSALRRGLINV